MSTTTILECERCGAPVHRKQLPDGHPFAKLMRSLPPVCDACIAVNEAEDSQRRKDETERQRVAELKARFKQSGMPDRHRQSLSELQHAAAVLDAAADWASYGGGLLLTGEIGVGKTTVAGAACWNRLQSKFVLWVSAPLLFARLGAGFGTEERDWAIDAISGRHGLVIDDLDKARPKEFAAEQMFLAIDQRVEHRTPLLVTTNLDLDQLSDRWPEPFGDAIASRLVGYCKVVRVEGDDRRLNGETG